MYPPAQFALAKRKTVLAKSGPGIFRRVQAWQKAEATAVEHLRRYS